MPQARLQRCGNYKWRSRYDSKEIADARKLKAPEEENRTLKKLLAETMLLSDVYADWRRWRAQLAF